MPASEYAFYEGINTADNADGNDSNAAINPDLAETCKGTDDNRDGRADEGGMKGAVDGNGNVRLADAIVALKLLLGIETSRTTVSGDVDASRNIGLAEAICILR